MYVCGHIWTTEPAWSSEEHLWETVLSFHHVRPGDQESGLVTDSLSHFSGPQEVFLTGIFTIPRLIVRYTFNNL